MRVSDFSMLWTPKLDSVGGSYNGQLSRLQRPNVAVQLGSEQVHGCGCSVEYCQRLMGGVWWAHNGAPTMEEWLLGQCAYVGTSCQGVSETGNVSCPSAHRTLTD